MIKRFLDYVEIRTKITSTFAFLITLALLMYQKQAIRWDLTGIFFLSMFLFDLTTTAINNYIDSRGNPRELQFPRKTALAIILVLFTVSAGLGIALAYRTDIVVFLVGGLCFLCGVCYTWGPLPISRMPLGEALSGAFYGIMIPFLLLYINLPAGTFLDLNVNDMTIFLQLHILPLLFLLLFAVTPFCATANIMLANNICDKERDILVNRHTLPYYIGDKALYLFAGLYYLSYASTVALVAVKYLSPVCLLSLATIPPVQKNIRLFFRKQEKATTFVAAIKNYMIIMGANTLLIFISALL